MIDRIQFIVPNLDRRPDRWNWCRESLLSQGVPAENIHRFSAFDGLNYLDSAGDHNNLSILEQVLSEHFGVLPPCLTNLDMALTQYAWFGTFYAMLDKIANMPENEYACWIIDDFHIGVSYGELLIYANILSEVAQRAWRTLFAIQLAHFTHEHNFTGAVVAECPRFQYGLSSPDDQCMVCSSRGARWMMNYINNLAVKTEKWRMDPQLFIATINVCNAKNGFFGIHPPKTALRRGKGGFAYICGIAELNDSLTHAGTTDRQISKHFMRSSC